MKVQEIDMNEELGNQLATFVASLNHGTQFAVANAPEVIQQFILVNIIQRSLGIVLCLSIIAVSYYFACVFKHKNDPYSDASMSQFMAYALGGLFSSLAFICLCYDIQNLILIYFAPKVFLIEQAAGFLK